MKSAGTLQLTAPGERDIVMTRVFDAPCQLVFDAHTKPELVKRWLLGPPGWTMPICEIDLRVGGKYHYHWRSDAGDQEFGFVGTFDQIDPEVRLNTTERVEGAPNDNKALIETSFADLGQKTRV